MSAGILTTPTESTSVPTQRARTRDEHLAWVRQRALSALDLSSGDLYRAFCSLYDDLPKHPECSGHAAINLASAQFLDGTLQTADDMRRFIRQNIR